MKTVIAIASAIALSACSNVSPTQEATLVAGAQTLASVAAAKSTTVTSLVTSGALFCKQYVQTSSPLIVALANLAGAPVSVTGMAADDVAKACAVIAGVPVAPPVDPASVPVVTAPVSLPATAASVTLVIPHGGSISAAQEASTGCVISDGLVKGCVVASGATVSLK